MISFEYTENSGFNLRSASINLAAGDLILKEETDMFVVCDERIEKNCANCLSENKGNLLVCTGCKIARYCDVDCQRMDWKRGHKLECRIFKSCQKRPTTTIRFIIRILFRIHLDRLALYPDGNFTRSVAPMGSLKKLVDHADQSSDKHMFYSQIIAKIYSFGLNYILHDVKEFMRLLMAIEFNAIGIQSNLETVGRALFPAYISFVNHSCSPNACLVFDQNKAELRALKPIGKNEPIFIAYIDICKPREWRKKYLHDEYLFDCHCSRCSDSEIFEDFDHQAKNLQQLIDRQNFEQAAILAEKLGDELCAVFGPYFPEVSLLYLKSFRCESAIANENSISKRLFDVAVKAYRSLSRFNRHIPLCKDLMLDLAVVNKYPSLAEKTL